MAEKNQKKDSNKKGNPLKEENFEAGEEKVSKKTVKEENKILKNFLITLGIIIFLLVAGYLYLSSTHAQVNFNYKGVNFTRVLDGKLVLYKTSIPVVYQGQVRPYDFFFRTNPNELENVPFNTTGFNLTQKVLINQEQNFNCNGDGVIAIANLATLYSVMGVNFTAQNATCSANGSYTYLYLKEGNKNEIVKVGNNCYDLVINNCKILPVTEKLMAEIFVKLHQR